MSLKCFNPRLTETSCRDIMCQNLFEFFFVMLIEITIPKIITYTVKI